MHERRDLGRGAFDLFAAVAVSQHGRAQPIEVIEPSVFGRGTEQLNEVAKHALLTLHQTKAPIARHRDHARGDAEIAQAKIFEGTDAKPAPQTLGIRAQQQPRRRQRNSKFATTQCLLQARAGNMDVDKVDSRLLAYQRCHARAQLRHIRDKNSATPDDKPKST